MPSSIDPKTASARAFDQWTRIFHLFDTLESCVTARWRLDAYQPLYKAGEQRISEADRRFQTVRYQHLEARLRTLDRRLDHEEGLLTAQLLLARLAEAQKAVA
jgi:hypothetical protein